MAAEIRFRGVGLYLTGAGDGLLHVLYPKTEGGVDRGNGGQPAQPAVHHALLSVFKKGGTAPIAGPMSVADRDLQVRTDVAFSGSLPGGLLSLALCVGNGSVPATPYSIKNQRATVAVALGSGSLSVAKGPDNHPWDLAAAGGQAQYGVVLHELVWTAPDDEVVQVRVADSGELVVEVGPTEMAVLGHYDLPADAYSATITPRQPDGVNSDVDFVWLYGLLDQPPASRPVPAMQTAPVGSAIKLAAAARMGGGAWSPLTSTCFGATWP